ncbi:MAG: LPS export ABC transporter permease LptF [Gammaproteobacteria bacterium HGW-Gammaproteobacteria-7]|nr:MAG: LPS export ABC transporter permease LptF [Gammaproteobacteria bacterium HGW-Gammaproteobacteria-7]
MRLIDRYLLRQFVQTTGATTAVLLMVSFSGIVADLLSEIVRGKVPAVLLASQLGLRVLQFLPLILPLALFLGLILAIGRLYRESEMTVLGSVGLGPRHMLSPLSRLAIPAVLVIATFSLWVGPSAQREAAVMIDSANRSLLLAGLEPGRFARIPGREGVLYVGDMTADGSRFGNLFIESDKEGRIDIVTAARGELFFDGEQERYLRLEDGFRVEGDLERLDLRMMRFERNDLRLPDHERRNLVEDPELRSTVSLILDEQPEARAELHWRLAMPIAAGVLSLLAIPLARSQPRQPRYGRLLLAMLGYLTYVNFLVLGTVWLAEGDLSSVLGLWWVHAPALLLTLWLLSVDGRLPRRAGAR